MANETIEDIVRDVRHVSELHGMSYKDDKNWHLTIHNYTRILADRIEAAHKREIIVERNLGTDEIDMAVAAKDATIALHEKVNDEQDTAIVKLTKELHDTERFLNWLMLSEKIGTWCKQQVEHRAKGVHKALAAAEGEAK